MSKEGVPEPPRAPFEVAGTEVAAGERVEIEIPVERLATGPQITIPVIAVHGRRQGPVVSISAAIHGDEINGVEAIRLLLADLRPKEIAGTLLFTPVVNELGFTMGQRYLPDRRDLNRAFPGTPRGSLAGRIAHLFMEEVIGRCEYAIDLHCGSDQRANLPQIRADLDQPRTRACAEAFGAPMLIHAQTRDGSLRQAASERGIAMLLYEGGESSRYDNYAIDAAHQGILRVLEHLGTIDSSPGSSEQTRFSRNTRWIRASRAGLFRADLELGDLVEHRGVLGHLSDIFGRQNLAVRATVPGVVIGLAGKPVVNQGDALVHVAEVEEG